MSRRSPLAALALALLALASACSFLDSANDLPPISSFHYLETATFTYHGETSTSHDEGFFQAPDSYRVLSDSEWSDLETILIGAHAWTHDATGWYSRDPTSLSCDAACTSYALLELYRRVESEDVGAGATVAGEPTRRYRFVGDNAGERIAESQARMARSSRECAELLAPVKDAWKDWTTSLEVVIGEESQRVYSVTVEASGSDMARRTEIEVDQYNERVEIEPPAGAEKLPQRTDAPGPCD